MENIALIGIDLGKTLSIFIAGIVAGRLFTVKFTRPKLIEFWRHAPLQPSQWKPVAVLTLWQRKLEELGHSPKLISPQFVRPFVKSNKTTLSTPKLFVKLHPRPSTCVLVQPERESQQAMRALHRVRESLVQDKVKQSNQMHAFLLEFGIKRFPRSCRYYAD